MASADAASLHAAWLRICDRLKAEVGDVEYQSWIQRITLGPLDDDEITLYLPERFLRDWVRTQYGQRLQTLWREETPHVQHVELKIDKKAQRAPMSNGSHAPSSKSSHDIAAFAREDAAALDAEKETSPTAASPSVDVRNDLAVPLDRRFTFDNFVVGKPNEFAYACAGRVADQPASPGFNPLFLYGGVGLGKTHLMHAIGLKLMSRGNISVAYMSAEKFMYRFIASMQSKSQMEFKEQLRSVDVLMIDDLQFLIGKNSTQEEFFHTFNALVDAGRQIIVSADKSPSDLSGLEDRLRTRLGCGMVADIHATTFELRISILEAKAKASGTPVPPKVLEYLAHKITTNVRELEGALNRLIAHADLVGRPVTLESTQDVLKDMLKAHERRVTIDEIQRKVVEHFNIRLTDMSSARRARAVARPRQIAMYLAKQLTSRSLPEIGRKFGNRDHTTVMHAVNRVAELMEQDPGLAESVELLKHMLES
ncbi:MULTISPECIES: chromosomal replication initiator protein DnaA [Bombella]|uniref:Chromosomal replication initiator protein DnaA n=1 Tax=Bombella pollinis TaxID=2967337 RepID=A0ABT3WJD5_9PROT|nr:MULTISPECIES: chromosomal replication initiator protein DnaA [Bombella]MCX5619210.1 chromosomal replication initiator protein DnaA [Bombella pollinis]MUG04684.1 chromosomal replication initiator protein DnaA [Bombella sp. ESL0378]